MRIESFMMFFKGIHGTRWNEYNMEYIYTKNLDEENIPYYTMF